MTTKERSERLSVAGFENGGPGPRAEGLGWPPASGKGKEIDPVLGPPAGGQP